MLVMTMAEGQWDAMLSAAYAAGILSAAGPLDTSTPSDSSLASDSSPSSDIFASLDLSSMTGLSWGAVGAVVVGLIVLGMAIRR